MDHHRPTLVQASKDRLCRSVPLGTGRLALTGTSQMPLCYDPYGLSNGLCRFWLGIDKSVTVWEARYRGQCWKARSHRLRLVPPAPASDGTAHTGFGWYRPHRPVSFPRRDRKKRYKTGFYFLGPGPVKGRYMMLSIGLSRFWLDMYRHRPLKTRYGPSQTGLTLVKDQAKIIYENSFRFHILFYRSKN